MKAIIFLLSIIVWVSANANTENETSNMDICASNGYSLDAIVKVEKTLQQALKTHDIALFAKQFQYPFGINLSKDQLRIISNPQELIDNFSLIYSQQDQEAMIAEKDLPFCRNDSASLFGGGLWLSKDENGNIKGNVINASYQATLSASKPYGVPIAPVKDAALLKEFLTRYENSDSMTKLNDMQYPIAEYFASKNYLLYHIDINNDGQLEWVVVTLSEGSMGASYILAVYTNKNNALQIISFDKVLIASFNLNLSGWYEFIAIPTFTMYKGKIICNYVNDQPVQVCSYLWQKNKVTLVHGDERYCIH